MTSKDLRKLLDDIDAYTPIYDALTKNAARLDDHRTALIEKIKDAGLKVSDYYPNLPRLPLGMLRHAEGVMAADPDFAEAEESQPAPAPVAENEEEVIKWEWTRIFRKGGWHTEPSWKPARTGARLTRTFCLRASSPAGTRLAT